MDFRKRIIQELKLSELQAETLLKDYVVVCEKLAKEYHNEQLNIGGVVNPLKVEKVMTFEEWVESEGYTETWAGYFKNGVKSTYWIVKGKYVMYKNQTNL